MKVLIIKKLLKYLLQGVEAVKQRGKADVGEKTMMDVLIPVAKCLQDGVQNNKEINEILTEAVQVAEKGMLSTKDLLATKGRASFLGERAKGHIDPGARSSQLMIKTVCESVIQK
jgi:dihydroxyacetone kinase-like protein